MPLNNYTVFNDVDGIYTYTYEAERKENCLACSQVPQTLDVNDPSKMKLKDIIQLLCESASFQMKNPGITSITNGKPRTLYMSTVKNIEEQTRENLNKSLIELGLENNSEIMVTDVTSPNTLFFKFKFSSNDIEMSI